MRNKLMILAVAAVAGVISVPFAAHARRCDFLTNQAIVELTDPPGVGGRTTVDQQTLGIRRWTDRQSHGFVARSQKQIHRQCQRQSSLRGSDCLWSGERAQGSAALRSGSALSLVPGPKR